MFHHVFTVMNPASPWCLFSYDTVPHNSNLVLPRCFFSYDTSSNEDPAMPSVGCSDLDLQNRHSYFDK